MRAILHILSRRLGALARALRAVLAEPGPLETDAFDDDGAVFQRAHVRRPK